MLCSLESVWQPYFSVCRPQLGATNVEISSGECTSNVSHVLVSIIVSYYHGNISIHHRLTDTPILPVFQVDCPYAISVLKHVFEHFYPFCDFGRDLFCKFVYLLVNLMCRDYKITIFWHIFIQLPSLSYFNISYKIISYPSCKMPKSNPPSLLVGDSV